MVTTGYSLPASLGLYCSYRSALYRRLFSTFRTGCFQIHDYFDILVLWVRINMTSAYPLFSPLYDLMTILGGTPLNSGNAWSWHLYLHHHLHARDYFGLLYVAIISRSFIVRSTPPFSNATTTMCLSSTTTGRHPRLQLIAQSRYLLASSRLRILITHHNRPGGPEQTHTWGHGYD